MPIYIYEHPESKQRKEIIQSVHENHEYIDQDGVRWNRIFTLPELNINDKLNEYSTDKDFASYTKKRKGTIGDLWDKSRELSEKREKIFGKDIIKDGYKKNWSKKRKNRRYLE
jgi:hypothetical protein